MATTDRVSEIVTNFLIYSCRSNQNCSEYTMGAWSDCCLIADERVTDDVEAANITLTTGSVAELYITPMYKCNGDVDIMEYTNNVLAVPAGQSPPVQLPPEFHSRVRVYELVDSEFAGYVYLVSSSVLTECVDNDEYSAMPCPRQYFSLGHSSYLYNYIGFEHGPAMTRELPLKQVGDGVLAGVTWPLDSIDRVRCIRCLSWPTQADNWPARQRRYDWPDSATVERVVGNGCDVVQVAHRLRKHSEWQSKYQCRLSFSRAEIVLLNSWVRVQQILYHMLRIFTKNAEILADLTDNTGSKLLSNYGVKTLMMWACELKSTHWWIGDSNVVKVCVELLHTLAVWLVESRCPHYFIDNCNLFDCGHDSNCAQLTASRLLSITESSLADWFVDNYVYKCAQHCPDHILRLFDDVGATTKLYDAVSAVARWKAYLSSVYPMCLFAASQASIAFAVNDGLRTVRSCLCMMTKLQDIDRRLMSYFAAVAFLQVAYKARESLNDELLDVLTTMCLQSNDARGCVKARYSSVLSLRQAVKLMKVVANNSRRPVQLIEIELSKAYLYRAVRCKDYDNDSIYSLANVYLAVLYYTKGQYQTAIDHCTLVTRPQDHSQCSSRVVLSVQGELLPKIDDDIDSALGLAVFYQYIRTPLLNQQRQQRHVSVFGPELFANYLHSRCRSVAECLQFTQTPSTDETVPYEKCLCKQQTVFTADLLLCRIVSRVGRSVHGRRLTVANHRTQPAVIRCQLDTAELVGSLLQSAVEHLTTFRQIEARDFAWATETRELESLYAYKRGDYERCLQLSLHDVYTLIGRPPAVSHLHALPLFLQLMDDDISSLAGLIRLVKRSLKNAISYLEICPLGLSLYLMAHSHMKLHHSKTELVQALHFIHVLPTYLPKANFTLEKLMLKLTERKIQHYIVLSGN